MNTCTFADAKNDLRLDDFAADPWGTTMSWKFAVADELYFHRDCLNVPDVWEFRPSPFGPDESDDLKSFTLKGLSDDDLMRFADMLHRLDLACRRRGYDY